MTPEEFRKAGHRLIDWIADYRAGVESRPVMARTAPGEIKASCRQRRRSSRSRSTRSSATSIASSLPGLTNWQHPRFFGYFPSNGLLSSVLGDYVSTGLGVVGPRVAVESGAHRGRRGRRPIGCGRCSACPSAGAASSTTPPRRARWSR